MAKVKLRKGKSSKSLQMWRNRIYKGFNVWDFNGIANDLSYLVLQYFFNIFEYIKNCTHTMSLSKWDGTERYFWSRFLLLCSPFLFPLFFRREEKRRMKKQKSWSKVIPFCSILNGNDQKNSRLTKKMQ